MEVVVLSARKWSFVDEKTGQVRDGVSVWYVDNVDFVPNVGNDMKGCELLKATLPVGRFGDFIDVPGVYDCDMQLRSRQNVPYLHVGGFRFVRPLLVSRPDAQGEVSRKPAH